MGTARQGDVFPQSLEGEETGCICIDTAAIPDDVRDYLSMKTLECFREFLATPGNAELLAEWTAERKAAQAVKERG